MKQTTKNQVFMKKLAGILAISMMALGATVFVAQNNDNEIDFMSNLETMLACGNCDVKVSERKSNNT